MVIIGIDLGTTNSLVSVWKNGSCTLIPSASGSPLTPSAVSIDTDGTLLVGAAAKECLLSRPEQTVCEFKRFMGTKKKFTIGKTIYLPEELSAMVLKKLKEDAETFLGESVSEAVISVPAYFNDDQRAATKRAGMLAGLTVERLVNEPSAAALACQAMFPQDSALYLVVDFGGGTLDVSLVECFDNVINVIAISGDNHLGGMDFDMAIAKHYCREHGLLFGNLPLARQRLLLSSAEKAKIALTESEETQMLVSTPEGMDKLPLSRRQLITIAADVFERFLKPIHRVIADSETSASEIDQIVLVGGSCKMPVVSMYLHHVLHQQPIILGSPDTVVAQGAGVYAAIKERREEIKEMVLTDICPFSLGIATRNPTGDMRGIMSTILERNTPLPSSREHHYVTCSNNQSNLTLEVYQGEEYYAEDNLHLGSLSIKVPPAPAGEEAVCVRFTYDADGLLNVVVRVLSTGKETEMLMHRETVQMTPEQMRQKKLELSRLSILPREREENRVLMEKAMYYHAQAIGPMKEFLNGELLFFLKTINSNSALKVSSARDRMQQALARAESYFDRADNFQELVSKDWYEEMLAGSSDDDDFESDAWSSGRDGLVH